MSPLLIRGIHNYVDRMTEKRIEIRRKTKFLQRAVRIKKIILGCRISTSMIFLLENLPEKTDSLG